MNVKAMLSVRLILAINDLADYLVYCANKASSRRQKELDNRTYVDVIIFTGRSLHDSAASARPSAKASDASPPWHAQPASGSRRPSAVSQQRLLRSRRPATGQVRDAASRSRRPGFYQRVRASLRLLSPIVLSGSVGVSAGRIIRLASPQAR